jgi:hypothetical protein
MTTLTLATFTDGFTVAPTQRTFNTRTGTIATSGSSQVVSATVPTGPTDDHRRMVWRIANIGAEAVLVLFYTGSHPNPADAAAARTAGAILLAPNSVEVLAVDQGLPNICVINA